MPVWRLGFLVGARQLLAPEVRISFDHSSAVAHARLKEEVRMTLLNWTGDNSPSRSSPAMPFKVFPWPSPCQSRSRFSGVEENDCFFGISVDESTGQCVPEILS